MCCVAVDDFQYHSARIAGIGKDFPSPRLARVFGRGSGESRVAWPCVYSVVKEHLRPSDDGVNQDRRRGLVVFEV